MESTTLDRYNASFAEGRWRGLVQRKRGLVVRVRRVEQSRMEGVETDSDAELVIPNRTP